MKDLEDSLKQILYKKARGYKYKEEVEEYQVEEEKEKKGATAVSEQLDFSSLDIDFKQVKKNSKKMTLIKKKVSSHHVPPDLTAIKMLLDYFVVKDDSKDYSTLSDKELEKLKNSLIDQLKDL